MNSNRFLSLWGSRSSQHWIQIVWSTNLCSICVIFAWIVMVFFFTWGWNSMRTEIIIKLAILIFCTIEIWTWILFYEVPWIQPLMAVYLLSYGFLVCLFSHSLPLLYIPVCYFTSFLKKLTFYPDAVWRLPNILVWLNVL